jgi:hypothetical protein
VSVGPKENGSTVGVLLVAEDIVEDKFIIEAS